jgi:hypothetical protein
MARCHYHGGKSHPGGPGHPAYRTGFYSKLLPTGLRKTYDKVLADPETLNAAEEVALLRTRIGQLVSRLQTGETGSVWGDLQAAYSELSAVVRSPEPDPVRFGEAFKQLGEVINRGADIETVWEELYDVVDQKTTVAAREHKRMVDLQAYITSERALALITAIMHSVVRNVPDLQARTRISHDVRALITRAAPLPDWPVSASFLVDCAGNGKLWVAGEVAAPTPCQGKSVRRLRFYPDRG